MTAGIHEVFRGSKFFSNAGVGKINKNLNIKYKLNNHRLKVGGFKISAESADTGRRPVASWNDLGENNQIAFNISILNVIEIL